MKEITPFLWFADNNAEEAVTLYTSIFPNSRLISMKRYPEGVQSGPMKDMGGKVLTAVFELNGQRFMALDGGPVFHPTPAISFLVECESQEEIDRYWEALSSDPASEQCGWCKDKYGFSWQIVPATMEKWISGPDTVGARRALDAMMQMKKLDMQALEDAYNNA
jgi:predicted 3-demethylubiquinone-9 3-methyltransferase (glyoxalase superfamily)